MRKLLFALACLALVAATLLCLSAEAAPPRHGTDGVQRLNGTKPEWTEFNLTGGRAASIACWGNLTAANVTMQIQADADLGVWMDVWNGTCSNATGGNCTLFDAYTPAVYGLYRFGFKANGDYDNSTYVNPDSWFGVKVKQ